MGTWLKDAQVEIEAWRLGMPDAMRVQLYSTLRDDESLEVRASDGWGKTVGIALYSIEAGGVRFYPGNPELMPNITLGNEQAFISHLLQLLQKKFNLPQ